MNNNSKIITKQEFDLLYDDKITKKQYDQIIKKIDERFAEICEIFLDQGRDAARGWYDYDNIPEYGDENFSGYFDPQKYKEDISITLEYMEQPPGFKEAKFPTRWLWEPNWEIEMNKIIADYKEKQQIEKQLKKDKLEKQNQRKEQLKQSIKAKLTPEEWNLVKSKLM